MANITVRNLDDEVKTSLGNAMNGGRTSPRDLAKFTRECFAPVGGIELDLPSRNPKCPETQIFDLCEWSERHL